MLEEMSLADRKIFVADDFETGSIPPAASGGPAPTSTRFAVPREAQIDSLRLYRAKMTEMLRGVPSDTMWLRTQDAFNELNITHSLNPTEEREEADLARARLELQVQGQEPEESTANTWYHIVRQYNVKLIYCITI